MWSKFDNVTPALEAAKFICYVNRKRNYVLNMVNQIIPFYCFKKAK